MNAVILPAHAQTSMGSQISPVVCTPLSIPGIGFTCARPTAANFVAYRINDLIGECPLLTMDGTPGETDTIGVEDFSLSSPSTGRAISIGSLSPVRHEIICNPQPSYTPNPPGTGIITAASGALYRATYTVNGDENGLSVEEIALTPL